MRDSIIDMIYLIFSIFFLHISSTYLFYMGKCDHNGTVRDLPDKWNTLSDGCPKDLGSGHQHSGPGD